MGRNVINLLISEFSELKRRFNNNRHSSRLIIKHRELRFTKRGYTHLDIPNFVPIFVQTSDQGSSSTSSLPHCNTRYFGKIAHLSFFKAFWDETNSVKVVRSLTVNSFFYANLQRRQCSQVTEEQPPVSVYLSMNCR